MEMSRANPWSRRRYSSGPHKSDFEFESYSSHSHRYTHPPYTSYYTHTAFDMGRMVTGSNQVERNSSSTHVDGPEVSDHSRSPLRRHHPHRHEYECESTAAGDVIVVEPSFDGENKEEESKEEQNRSPGRVRPSASPSKHGRRRHTRDLSAHFFDATKITEDETGSGETKVEQEDAPAPAFREVGQKHRRMFSGGASNPPLAHRRINSIGNSAAVDRRYSKGRLHNRENSAGLDVLSAVAGVTKAELAAVAGERPSTHPATSWEAGRSGSAVHRPHAIRSSGSFGDYPAGSTKQNRSFRFHSPTRPTFAPRTAMHPMAPFHLPHYPPPHMYPLPPGHGHMPFGVPHSSRMYPPSGAQSYHVYSKQHGHFPVHPGAYHPGPDPAAPPSRSSSPVRDSRDRDRAPPTAERPIEKEKAKSSAPLSSAFTETGATSQGVQTFVTAISVGDGCKTIYPTKSQRNASVYTESSDVPSVVGQGHHRRLSSFSNILMRSSIASPGPEMSGEHPLKKHHRQLSSGCSNSFLKGMDVALDGSDAAFLRNLHASAPNYGPLVEHDRNVPDPANTSMDSGKSDGGAGTKLAQGGSSKRVRRKCSVENCPNRVVQGGLCIAHGAKRKTCKHPGCTKNVKQAGLCSTHGPARKRCEAEGCNKVAVQGGRCIAHGAKKKLCSIEDCKKQAILCGMCKKHHDKVNGIASTRGRNLQSERSDSGACSPTLFKVETEDKPNAQAASKHPGRKTHTRGLSIFQDLSADAVQNLLCTDDVSITGSGVRPVSEVRSNTESSETNRRGSSRGSFIYM